MHQALLPRCRAAVEPTWDVKCWKQRLCPEQRRVTQPFLFHVVSTSLPFLLPLFLDSSPNHFKTMSEGCHKRKKRFLLAERLDMLLFLSPPEPLQITSNVKARLSSSEVPASSELLLRIHHQRGEHVLRKTNWETEKLRWRKIVEPLEAVEEALKSSDFRRYEMLRVFVGHPSGNQGHESWGHRKLK